MPSERSWHSFDQVAIKWRDLAERRRDYYVELHRSGRWQRYYTEESFARLLRAAVRDASEWSQIAAETSLRAGAHVARWQEAAE